MTLKQFLNLEWKQYVRSAYWQKSIAINILLVFLALYFMLMFLIMGIALYPGLKEVFPEQDPFVVVNNYLFYYVLMDIVLRFFFQKLPVMSVKPLLTLPVRRSNVVHYVLRKSAFSFFNFLPLFAFLPFSIMLLANGYPPGSVITWFFAIVILTLIINFLNFIIESFSSETELSFLPLLLITGGLFALNFFNIISFSEVVSSSFQAIYASPIFIVVTVSYSCRALPLQP